MQIFYHMIPNCKRKRASIKHRVLLMRGSPTSSLVCAGASVFTLAHLSICGTGLLSFNTDLLLQLNQKNAAFLFPGSGIYFFFNNNPKATYWIKEITLPRSYIWRHFAVELLKYLVKNVSWKAAITLSTSNTFLCEPTDSHVNVLLKDPLFIGNLSLSLWGLLSLHFNLP